MSQAERTTPARGARRVPVLAPGDVALLLAGPLWLWWAARHGGYPVSLFVPGLLFLIAAVLVLMARVPPAPLRGARAVAVAALAGLAALDLVSVLWAQDRGLAWTAGERSALFALAFALPVLWPCTRRGLLAALVLLVAASVVATIAGLVAAFGGGEALADGRLTDPALYANATAALILLGAAAALPLAVDRSLGVFARAGLAGAAGALVAASVLTQSRGAVLACVAVAVAAVALGPRRWAVAALVVVVGLAIVALREPLLDVRNAALDGDADDALRTAILAILAVAAVCGAAAALLSRADGLRAPRAPFPLGRAAAALLLVGVVAIMAFGDPVGWIDRRADDLATPDYSALDAGDSRLSGDLGSNRVDYWRASTDTLADHPVLGVGGGGFAEAYLLRRRTDLEPLYAHSAVLQAAADHGVPGVLLMLLFAGALAVALAAAWRHAAPRDRGLLAAAVLPLVYVAVHGAADWVTAFAGVVVPALGLAGAAISGAAGELPAERWPRGRRFGLGAVLVVLALSALPLFLGGRYLQRGADVQAAAPQIALEDFRRAGDVNVLSPGPPLNEGLVAVRLGRLARARSAFEEAVDRNPDAWFPSLMLGVLVARDGDPGRARVLLDGAVAANPRDRRVRAIRNQSVAGHPPHPAGIARTFVE